jgi:hypothetical protein
VNEPEIFTTDLGFQAISLSDFNAYRRESERQLRELRRKIEALAESWMDWTIVAPADYGLVSARVRDKFVPELRAILSRTEPEPWPLLEVLNTLCAFAEMMLYERNYDGHDYESLKAACEAGRKLQNSITHPTSTDVLREALEHYGQHISGCPAADFEDQDCTCGLAVPLAALLLR